MYMKTTARYILTLLWCICSVKALPQTGLSLNLLNYTFEADTLIVNPGFRITIYTELTNVAQDTFESTLEFGLRNNQQDLSAIPGIFNKPSYSGKTIRLTPGETVPAIFSVKIDAPYYAPGPDVVVVWPISNSPILDSVIIPLIVDAPMSSAGLTTQTARYIISDGQLHLLQAIENPVKQVRIFNLNGQQLSNVVLHNASTMPAITLPKGLLFVEVIYADRKRAIIKLPNW